MPRPKLHSDEAILNAAQQVLVTRGPSNFTLSDVANALGISRAALIQRFTDKATLHLRVMERSTAQVRDYFAACDTTPGLDPLWAMLRDLIEGMGSGEGFAGYLLLEWSDVVDERLNALARERNRLVRDAIAMRLPDSPHDPATAAGLIQAVIQGASMQWLIDRPGALNSFVTDRTRAMLAALYRGHAFA